jgi:hypothetical protein
LLPRPNSAAKNQAWNITIGVSPKYRRRHRRAMLYEIEARIHLPVCACALGALKPGRPTPLRKQAVTRTNATPGGTITTA